jgi:hypothetical protein
MNVVYFAANQIEEQSFFLLVGDDLVTLIPQLGPRLRFQQHFKKFIEVR